MFVEQQQILTFLKVVDHPGPNRCLSEKTILSFTRCIQCIGGRISGATMRTNSSLNVLRVASLDRSSCLSIVDREFVLAVSSFPCFQSLWLFGGSWLRSFKPEVFAMTEMAYVITRMVQCFESIESRDKNEWKERLGVNLSSLNGVKVGLTARERWWATLVPCLVAFNLLRPSEWYLNLAQQFLIAHDFER